MEDYFRNIFNKAERLSAALFLISKTINDDELLKTRIKNLAIGIVSKSIVIKDNMKSNNYYTLRELENMATELASLINIAGISGIVSSMNAKILSQEFSLFLVLLAKAESYAKNYFKLAPSLFGLESTQFLAQNDQKMKMSAETGSKQQKLEAGEHTLSNNGSNSRNELRERSILSLIAEKGTVSIKDISKSIRGCSEKTVQRKLLSLVGRGIVKKVGERRWSKYSMA